MCFYCENPTMSTQSTCVRVHRLLRERMSREAAESRVRLQEDQLAELQEELRRVSENSSDSLHTVITHTHTQTRNIHANTTGTATLQSPRPRRT